MEDIKFEKVPSGIFDKVKTNKEEFIEKFIDDLEELFPDTVKDGKVDFQALLERFGEYQDNEERYELTWVGKNKARQESFEDIVGKTLKYIEEDSKNPETTENIYIEGDNLEVLKLLRKSYYGKIKVIYIDPPYNRRKGDDLIYKDDFTLSKEEYDTLKGDVDQYENRLVKNSSDSGRYHSNWLNMMYPRLQVAKDLLTEDGAIFISIDDNEVHNMRKICDEIFGENNFISGFIWERNKKPSFLNSNLGTKTEHILVYGKSRIKVGALSVDTTEVGKKYPLNNAGNGIKNIKFPPNSVRFSNYENELIESQDMSEGNIITKLLNDFRIRNGYNQDEFSLRGEWRYSQERINEIVDNGEEIVISKIPFRPNHIKKGGEIKKIHNLLTTLNYELGTNEDATEEQEKIFGKNYFDYAKPSNLIKFIVKSTTYSSKDCIILDFFSGSATTAHAVMDLNLEDNGNRKFIMVQLPEPIDKKSAAYKEGYENICEIGKERIRLSGDKILKENKDKEGIENLDIGFKVFRVADTNFKRIADRSIDADITELKYKSKKDSEDFNPHFTDLDVVYELMLRRQDIELTEEVKRLDYIGERTYIVGDTMLVCLEEVIDEEIVEKIGDIDTDLSWIVLRDSAFDDNCELKINTTKKLRSIIKSSRQKSQKIYWI